MRFVEFCANLKSLSLRKGSIPDSIRNLLLTRKLLATPMTSQEVRDMLYERTGLTIKTNNLTAHMAPFLRSSLVLRKKMKVGSEERVIWSAAWQDQHSLQRAVAGADPFDQKLTRALGTRFKTELVDFMLVYGKSGTCTAFMIRKILEKATFIALVKCGIKDSKLKDSSGRYLGLESLLDIATKVKIDGLPLLSPKVHEKVQGVKFLGDSAAHNYLVNVDSDDLVPQLPYVTLALREIAKGLV